jgi:hypothetical protein
MIGRLIRKFFVVLIITAPVVSYQGCRKQEKCGCDGDVIKTLTQAQATVYWNETGSTISFSTFDNPYATYNFCNPAEMFPRLAESKSGDILIVSGNVYWECNYLYQQSNYSYRSPYTVYMIQVTDVYSDLYGKK